MTLDERRLTELEEKAKRVKTDRWYYVDRLTDEESGRPGGTPADIVVEDATDAEFGPHDGEVLPHHSALERDEDLEVAAEVVRSVLSLIAELRAVRAERDEAKRVLEGMTVTLDGWRLHIGTLIVNAEKVRDEIDHDRLVSLAKWSHPSRVLAAHRGSGGG